MLEFIFWFSVLIIFYAYFGYPLCLVTIIAYRKVKGWFTKSAASASSPIPSTVSLPSVTLIITAYNEERRIEDKIENSLALDYPRDRLEIIVASDCSSDSTDAIVKTYDAHGVKLVRSPERGGKENAQKHAVDVAAGEILVFSDVATILEPDGLANIVRNFINPDVGCVSSVDRFIDKDGTVSGEGAYVAYEMFLRRLESKVNTLVGLSGSFFAARREVCQNWQTDLQSDFNTLLNSVRLGLKGISDPKSIGYYHNIADEKKEFQRKVRTVLRGISVLMRNLTLLNPVRHGMFAWQLISHKLCRWLVPFLMLLAYITNLLVFTESGLLTLLFLAQNLLYGSVLFYYFSEIKGCEFAPKNLAPVFKSFVAIAKLPYFFTTVNYSILVAWLRFIKGERATFWEPSKR